MGGSAEALLQLDLPGPSLCAAQSYGSSGRLIVTGPFSVIPHSENSRVPDTSRTSSTKYDGTGLAIVATE
jgi:hypothetical protein